MFRIAAVSFLNTIPLIDGLADSEGDRVVLTRDLPSRLPALLQNGSADVALLPVAEVLRYGSGDILPVGGIACCGPVDSVKLFTKVDLPDLRRISADRGSRSSVALLRVLLAELFGLQPAVAEAKPRTGVLPAPDEGILIIGDRCFEYERFLRKQGHAEIRAWDLGELWWELSGLPFVFAVWVVAHDFPRKSAVGGLDELRSLLSESLRSGLANRTLIAEREAEAGRLGRGGYATAAAIDYYFQKSLCFTIGDEELAGISRFHQLAMKHEVIPAGPMPQIL